MGLIAQLRDVHTVRRANRLAGRGDLTTAVGNLRAANRAKPSPRLERALVDLLLQTGGENHSGSKVNQAAHASASHTFSSGTVPEISAESLTPAILRDAIEQAGYLIVRGFFKREDSAEIRSCIDASLNARVDSHEASELTSDEPWYYPSPHFPGSHVAYSKLGEENQYTRTGSMMVIDSPRGSFKVLELYQKYGLKELVEDFFGEPAVLATRKWVFRLVEPRVVGDGIGGGWHQDGQFMGADIRALNLWVALSECGDGTDAPGMSLLPKRVREILETGTRGANINWVVPGELVKELAEENPVVRPRFDEGDALFFDHFSLHRSGHRPGQTANRYALESWFYAKGATADNAVIDFG